MMKNFLVLITLVTALFIGCISQNSNPSSNIEEDGRINLTIKIDKIGQLAKKTDIDLDSLYIIITALDEDTVRDSLEISGNTAQTVTRSYTGLASLFKTWTANIYSKDVNGEIVHAKTQDFIVPSNGTIDVEVDLASLYSMLSVMVSPIRDSVTGCALFVDGSMVDEVTFPKQSIIGQTVALSYDYLTCSETGIDHEIVINVYGDMWGIDTLLYSGKDSITALSGQNGAINDTVYWVCTATDLVPAPGGANINAILGAVGTYSVQTHIDEVLEDGMIAYYPFNGDADDASGNSYDGVVYGAVLTEDRFGNANNAYFFDGVDDYIEVSNILETGVEEITLSAWVSFATMEAPFYGYSIFSKADTVSNRIDFNLSYLDNQPSTYEHRFQFTGNTFAYPFLARSSQIASFPSTFGFSVAENIWYLLTATYSMSSNRATLYINGIEVEYDDVSNTSLSGSTEPLLIGRNVDFGTYVSRFMYGAIDDVRIYDRALSEAEITKLFVN